MMDQPEIAPTLISADAAEVENGQGRMARRVPVTVLTGFLGAGKSTLLRRILSERHGIRFAVIMNELTNTFGVEKAMLKQINSTATGDAAEAANAAQQQTAAEEWLEVENGCLCCTAKNETFLALESLLRRRQDIDHVVIEASGAADPSELVKRLWIDEALECVASLDGVVCIADASNVGSNLEFASSRYAPEAARQVALADVVLLNKIDLVAARDVDSLQALILNINPTASIITTSYGRVDLGTILEIGEYNETMLCRRSDRLEQLFSSLAGLSLHGHATSIGSQASLPIRATTLCRPTSKACRLDLNRFERWFFTVLWERSVEEYRLAEDEQILRVKGIIRSARGCLYVVQAVQDQYDLHPIALELSHSMLESVNNLVIIGKLRRESEIRLQRSYNQLAAK